jgi:hypothetical protein
MPTCVRCGEWSPPSRRERECPVCGGSLRSGETPSPEALAVAAARRQAKAAADTARTQDELEAEKARKLAYVSEEWDDGFAMIGAWVFALVIALATGVVLLVVFAAVGRSPRAAVAGTATGVLAGAVLVPILFFGADFILSRLVRLRADNRRVRQAGCTTFEWIGYALLVLPAIITVVASLMGS